MTFSSDRTTPSGDVTRAPYGVHVQISVCIIWLDTNEAVR